MVIVDARTHLGNSRNSSSHIGGQEIIDAMDAAGVQVAVVQPLPSAAAIEPVRLHDETAELCARYPKRLFGLASIPPQIGEDAYRAEAERCIRDLGFVGLKYHCLFHGGGARNPEARYCWDAGRALGVPVTVHTGLGIPLALPALYLPTFQSYPDVNFILAHSGAWITSEEAAMVGKMCPNAYLDTSWHYPQTVLGFLKAVGYQKIMMASDFPSNLMMQRTLFDSVGLNDEQKAHCLGGLALDLFKLHDKI
jgi:predicted TIM-barrel fold metal-dependent hydrolase